VPVIHRFGKEKSRFFHQTCNEDLPRVIPVRLIIHRPCRKGLFFIPVFLKKKNGGIGSATCLERHLLVDDRVHAAGIHGHDNLNPVRTPGPFQFNRVTL